MNSTVPHQQQVMVLVQGLCVQPARAPLPGAVWKMDTDICQSLFSNLPFSPSTGKPPKGSVAGADRSSAGSVCLMTMKSPFVWRKFSAGHLQMYCSPLLVPELCKVAGAEQKIQSEQHVSWRLHSCVLVDGYCFGRTNHRGLHFAGVTWGCFCGFGKRNSPLLSIHSLQEWAGVLDYAAGSERGQVSFQVFHLYVPRFSSRDALSVYLW